MSTKRKRQRAGQRPHARRPYIWQSHTLSAEQVQQLKAIAGVYTADLHDPAAVEVLLVLLEVCRVLALAEGRQAAIFGARGLRVLELWGDAPPSRQRPGRLRRVWVWLPNTPAPALRPVEEDGSVRVYAANGFLQAD